MIFIPLNHGFAQESVPWASTGRAAILRRRPWWRIHSFVLILASLAGGLQALAATNFYVSPAGGLDSNSGQTPEAPFKTLQRALEGATAGDTIYLRAGTYAESVSSNKGTLEHPLTIQAYQDEIPIMTRGEYGFAMWMVTQGMVLRGLRFTSGHLVFKNAANVRVENCRFEGITGNDALYLGNCHSATIQNNLFNGNRHTATLVLAQTSGNVVVKGNQFTDNFPVPGANFNVILLSETVGQTLIASNIVCNTTTTPVEGVIVPLGADANAILVYRSIGVTLTGNTVRDFRFHGTNDDSAFHPTYLKTPEQGGEVGSGIGVVGSTPVVVESITITSNIVSNCSRHGIVCSYVNDSLIADNTVLDCGNFGIFLTGIVGESTQVTGNLVRDNICGRNGWLHGGASGISFIEVGPNNIMRRNFCFGNKQGTAGTVGADWWGDGMGLLADLNSNGTIIENNLSVGNEGSGIALHADNCTVINNTVIGNGNCPQFVDGYGILVNGDTGHANNATIVNNLVYNNRRSQLFVFETGLAHTIHHNLYRAGPLTVADHLDKTIGWGGQAYTVAAWNALMAANINGTGNLDAVPVFAGDTTQMTADPFRLAGKSPGLATGSDLTGFDALIGYRINWDYQNRLRDVSAPTLGAFETDVSPTERAFPGAVSVGSDWLHTDWFGWVMVKDFPWIWKEDLGFLYSVGQSTTGLWLYAHDINDWLWTTQSSYPNLYSSQQQAWLFYQKGSTNPKWFFNYATARWFTR